MKEQLSTVLVTQKESIDIIDVIRKQRNDLIKDFLDERNLISYLSTQYKVMELSNIKVQFIKTDLKRLLIAPVDLEWYKPIIDDYEKTASAALAEENEKLFYSEIEKTLKRFLYI